jgi:hypothetical protein
MRTNGFQFGAALAALLALTQGAAAASGDACIQENNVVNLIQIPVGNNALDMNFANQSRHALWCQYIFMDASGKSIASGTFALAAYGKIHIEAHAKGLAAAQPTQACYLAEPPASTDIAKTCAKDWAAKSVK